jgi:hypothetical protein
LSTPPSLSWRTTAEVRSTTPGDSSINCRSHRRRVSGVTRVSIWESPFFGDHLGLRGETPALLIGESQSLSAHLLPQRSILLLEMFDDFLLMATDPAGEDQHQELQRQSVLRVDSRPVELGEMG